MIESFVEFAKYGIWGVTILLIVLIGYIFKMFYKMVTNHMEHSNEAYNKNTEALIELKVIMKEFIKKF